MSARQDYPHGINHTPVEWIVMCREIDLLREVARAARRLCDMGNYPALNATLKAWETR